MQEYDELVRLVKRAGVTSSIAELLSWDQQVMMPSGAKHVRAEQMGLIKSIQHELAVHPRIGELLTKIDRNNLNEEQQAQVHEIEWAYRREIGIPTALAEEFAVLTASADSAWNEAKNGNNFLIFLPFLERIVEKQREIAHCMDPNREPYEVLMENFESGLSLASVNKFFGEIKSVTVPLVEAISKLPVPDTSILEIPIQKSLQMGYNTWFTRKLGYDLGKGRLDLSSHPMTIGFGRITTNLSSGWWNAISSTMHEKGHGDYEHNLPFEHFGTPLGTARSLGIHESQSRLWENQVGKSLWFWEHNYDDLQSAYHHVLKNTDVTSFYRLINVVKPGFVRVDADELTYILHIALRFEIEQSLISGDLAVKDVPEAWDVKMEELLGIIPPTDTLGCLQDIHWSGGWLGYFPTYVVPGNMVAAQLFNMAAESIAPELFGGNTKVLGEWLHQNIHRHGCRYGSLELVRRATGKELGSEDYTRYLTAKFSELYKL